MVLQVGAVDSEACLYRLGIGPTNVFVVLGVQLGGEAFHFCPDGEDKRGALVILKVGFVKPHRGGDELPVPGHGLDPFVHFKEGICIVEPLCHFWGESVADTPIKVGLQDTFLLPEIFHGRQIVHEGVELGLKCVGSVPEVPTKGGSSEDQKDEEP